MKKIGAFQSQEWGPVDVMRCTYLSATGPLAIRLVLPDGRILANLSVNLVRAEASHDSRDLPPDCFYVKTWDSPELVADAFKSGLFIERDDLPRAQTGRVDAGVWQVKP